MRFERHPDAGDFLTRAQEFLERDEAVNNLTLGVCTECQRFPERIKGEPLFTTVNEGEAVCGVGVMTRPHTLLPTADSGSVEQVCAVLAEHLHDSGQTVRDVFAVGDRAECFARAWRSVTGRDYRLKRRSRAYEVRRVVYPGAARGRLRVATEVDAAQLAEWSFGFYADIDEPHPREEVEERVRTSIGLARLYVWEDDAPVSMAAAIRRTTRGVAIGSVYTPPEHRGKGYATACVARLSQNLLDSGRAFCMLFADLDNPVSNAIYRRIGYVPRAEFASLVVES